MTALVKNHNKANKEKAKEMYLELRDAFNLGDIDLENCIAGVDPTGSWLDRTDTKAKEVTERCVGRAFFLRQIEAERKTPQRQIVYVVADADKLARFKMGSAEWKEISAHAEIILVRPAAGPWKVLKREAN
jgi:hypothetical protein